MIEVQQLNTHEAKRLRHIRLAALRDAPYAFGTTFSNALSWSTADWLEQLHTTPTFIAVLNGADCGLVRSLTHPEKAHVAELISMWVAPQARGKGVGGALIKTVIDWSRDKGYKLLSLDVSEGNRFAIALYERYGFKATGVTNCFPLPREHIKEYEMALNL